MGLARIERARPRIFLFSFVSCLSLQAGWSFISVLGLSCRGSACLINGIKRYARRRFGEACQCSPSSYDDGAADDTNPLAGIKVRALVRGEAASSASVPACSADNGPGIHMAKIAVVA